jgi:hypothetical protein
MLRKGQEGHVRAERDVLKGAALVSNPNGAEWIVRLFYSFQDRDHLYLVRTGRPERTVLLKMFATPTGFGIHGRRRSTQSSYRKGCV